MSFDRRVTPARPDLAAAHLRGKVEADRFVEGRPRSVTAAVAPLRREPRLDCPLDTEALRGEAVMLYEETAEGWAWVQLVRDGYCGYLPAAALGEPEAPTQTVVALRTLVFPGPDLKMPVVGALTRGARLPVSVVSDGYARIPEGYVPARHLAPIGSAAPDFVAVAETFLAAPYLWGGKTSLGLDCSGLVQVALDAAGVAAPRDSDMQRRDLGRPLAPEAPLQRGDLVFWHGHVGIMRDLATLLHANAHAMCVTAEPLAKAQARIRETTGTDVLAIKRL